jgi:hypothetical protein
VADDRRFGERRAEEGEEGQHVPSPGVLLQMIRNVERTDQEGHERNHERFDKLAERLDDLEHRSNGLERDVSGLRDAAKNPRKVDVGSELFYPTRVVIALVMFAFILGAGQWAAAYFSTAGLKETLSEIKSDYRDLATRFDMATKEIRYEQARQSDRLNDHSKEIQNLKETKR